MNATITNIKRNALDDGPGIRTLIFFKGCPLNCVWCQNPETKTMNQGISFDIEVCIKCLECQETCPENAINHLNIYPIDLNACYYCGKCVEICKMEALRFTAFEYKVEELINEIIKDKVFYDNSGGGITLSGGEAMMQFRFLGKFLPEVKKHGIHVCLETCGYFDFVNFKNFVLPYLDLVYYDLKIFENSFHNKYCGTDNNLILHNFEKLIKINSIDVLPRIPLIPNITTTKKNLTQWKSYLENHNITKLELLPYNPLWISKISKLGQSVSYNRTTWLTKQEKDEIKSIFSKFEFKNF
ncbi:MAG: glycyl-radical enzyme activating protein [Candidatus Lokiarchaeota archaeon]|nr:glycyl-radical enzyme activating protein [Candidatus Lokiarchaeota archaeon]MBD3199280.1 glycyl-radical enzyme activating protein [Candidatus Lokiarchaeota archaeon]